MSDLEVSIERRMLGQVLSLVESQLPDRDVLASTGRPQVKKVLPFAPAAVPVWSATRVHSERHIKSTPARTRPGYSRHPVQCLPDRHGGKKPYRKGIPRKTEENILPRKFWIRKPISGKKPTKDLIQTKTVVERGSARERRKKENAVREHPDRRNTVTRLIWMEVILM